MAIRGFRRPMRRSMPAFLPPFAAYCFTADDVGIDWARLVSVEVLCEGITPERSVVGNDLEARMVTHRRD